MDCFTLKKQLEDLYCIGFVVKKNNSGFNLCLEDSDLDKFQIIIKILDARFVADITVEKYGASFLNLLNKSNFQQRNNFLNIANKNLDGNLSISINNSKIDTSSFVTNISEWNEFSINYYKFPFEGNDEDIYKAIEDLIGMMLSLFEYTIIGFEEGNKIDIHASKYERNPINRKICLAYKGYKCACCGFDFEKAYGILGKNTIEVHHIVPVSDFGKNYVVKPLEDLVPVCSNCHTMLHKKNPPLSIDELKELLEANKK